MTPESVLSALGPSATVALLVAADPTTAPDAAWALARAAAVGRQAALIDLTLGEGALDAGADDAGTEGIVDVFEFGASWSHVARPQGVRGLYFVPDGTPATDPHAIWGHARWEKLRRGFQQQKALLLLFVPGKALADLAPRADVVIALGEGPDVATARALAAGRDLPMLGPVLLPTTQTVPEPEPATEPEPEPVVAEATTTAGARWLPWVIGAVAALTVFGGAFVLLRPDPPSPAPEEGSVPIPAPEPAMSAAAADPVAGAPANIPPPDTLFYTVQVAAFNRLGPATALAAGIERAGHLVAITPVHIGERRDLWYRILVGAVESPGAAASFRSELWRAGLLERGRGTVLRVPHTWALDLTGAGDPAAVLAGLRRRGIPAYIVSGPDAPTLFLGAFETPEQASAAESLLTGAGQAHTLVARRGTTN